MNFKQSFLISTLTAIFLSVSIIAQEEKPESVKEAPIVDEFSLVMRNFMKRAKLGNAAVSNDSADSKLDSKVDGIQALLNQSDSELSKASLLKSDKLVPPSESLQIQELEKLQAKIEEDEEKQVAELLITKAKIASIKKNIKSEKQRLALEKASASVETALKLFERTKE